MCEYCDKIFVDVIRMQQEIEILIDREYATSKEGRNSSEGLRYDVRPSATAIARALEHLADTLEHTIKCLTERAEQNAFQQQSHMGTQNGFIHDRLHRGDVQID